MMQSEQRGFLVCAKEVIRRQVGFDSAYLLASRREFAEEAGGFSRWAWGDSSPQAGRDWFQCKETYIKNSDLLKVTEAIDILTCCLTLEDGRPPDHPDLLDIAKPHNDTLASCIRQHMKVPMAKGQGCSSVEHLAACFVQACYLEAKDVDDLHRMLGEYVSFTSELGTDCGIRSFRVSSAEDVLPEWLQSPKVELVPDMIVEVADAAAPAVPEAATTRPLLPTGLDVSGALHILSNLPKDIEKSCACGKFTWRSSKCLSTYSARNTTGIGCERHA